MALMLGDTAPNFTQDSTEGAIDFHQWKGDSWCVLFSHPADFTPVCTTELGTVAELAADFERRNCKTLALSVDSVDSHHEWIKDINETQKTTVNFPVIADHDRKVADLYGMIHPKADDTKTVRSVFVIDPKNTIRLTLTYPASTGRNFAEILRVIDSIQLTEYQKVATPANWEHGDDCVILPSITEKGELDSLFPEGYEELRPYLRMTKQPAATV